MTHRNSKIQTGVGHDHTRSTRGPRWEKWHTRKPGIGARKKADIYSVYKLCVCGDNASCTTSQHHPIIRIPSVCEWEAVVQLTSPFLYSSSSSSSLSPKGWGQSHSLGTKPPHPSVALNPHGNKTDSLSAQQVLPCTSTSKTSSADKEGILSANHCDIQNMNVELCAAKLDHSILSKHDTTKSCC